MNEEISKSVLKTGTLTLGIVCKDGIVVAADRRQSYGGPGGGVSYIASKAKKIQELNDRIIATTAGTASDSRKIVDIIKAEIRLKELKTREKITVEETANLLSNMVFHNIRTPSMIPSIAHFLLAGYDSEGFSLYDIAPDGYMQKQDDYAVSGAGVMQAHPHLDSEYKKGMSIEDGIKLAIRCLKSAMTREPSVGEGADIYVVKKDEVKQVLAQEAVYEFKDKK